MGKVATIDLTELKTRSEAPVLSYTSLSHGSWTDQSKYLPDDLLTGTLCFANVSRRNAPVHECVLGFQFTQRFHAEWSIGRNRLDDVETGKFGYALIHADSLLSSFGMFEWPLARKLLTYNL